MWKEKIGNICNYILKHSKIAFPVIVIAAVAVTVVVAMNAGSKKEKLEEETPADSTPAASEAAFEAPDTDVSLTLNEDSNISTLILTFYNALALGDADTLESVCDEISEKDMLHFLETSKYIDSYPVIEIYTKPGPEEGTTIAYVYYKVNFFNQPEPFPGYKAYYICTDEQRGMYIKRGENSDEVNEYIKEVSAQDDVVEFNNRVTVEYNELMMEHPELLEYLSELDAQVSTAVGVALAQKEAEVQQAAQAVPTEAGIAGEDGNGEQSTGEGEQIPESAPAAEQPLYATATTTVNVRVSDSEQADKLGKVSGGSKVQLLEQRVNGWSKILFEGKEGYIKSEYLQTAESADGSEAIGMVTAATNINVRSAASETAEKLGVLTGGDSAELVARENGWCKIKYNGQIGYVKEEYVQ